MATVGVETQNHGTFSCHSLEAHRRLILSNDHDDTHVGYQTIANKASIEVSNADATGHVEFISAFHDGTRPQVQLTGDVTFAAGSTLALPGGVTTVGPQTATDLIAQDGEVTVKDGDTVVAKLTTVGAVSGLSASLGKTAIDDTGLAALTVSATGITVRQDVIATGQDFTMYDIQCHGLNANARIAGSHGLTIHPGAPSYIKDVLNVEAAFDASDAVALGKADTAPGAADGADVAIRRDLVVAGSLTVNGTTTSVNSTELEIQDKKIELGVAAAATTAAAHRTTCSGGLQLGFGGYDDSDDSDTRKSLGNLEMEFGATSADDQFKVSHRMETPALHVQSGGGLRINGTTAGTYCEMAYDEATDRFTIKRYVAGGQTKQNTISFT